MSIWHESIRRMLTGNSFEGKLTSNNGLDLPVRMTVNRLEPGAGLHDWNWHVEIERDNERHSTSFSTAIRWAGSTPVVSVPQLDVHGLGRVSGKLLIHNRQFAGTMLINGKKVTCAGRLIADDETTAEHPRYVIERSSEFLRDWWTGEEWTEQADAARWYLHEPDAPAETEDEAAHAVYYKSGTVEPG